MWSKCGISQSNSQGPEVPAQGVTAASLACVCALWIFHQLFATATVRSGWQTGFCTDHLRVVPCALKDIMSALAQDWDGIPAH